MLDLLLSACHFLLVFALVAILAAQNALIRPGITPSSLRLASDLDRAYGASTLLLIGVVFGRVYLGCKGLVLFSMESPPWKKIGLFMTVALLPVDLPAKGYKHAEAVTFESML